MGVENAAPLKAENAPVCRAKQGRSVVVHGVLVQVSGLGVLVMGDSGIGKTACGLDLVARGCFWIADDAVVLERRGDVLYGRGHERTKKLIAVRGRGVLDTRCLLGAEAILDETQVSLVIQFIRHSYTQGKDRDGESESLLEIEGIPVCCRRVTLGGGSGKMADEVLASVKRALLEAKRGTREEDDEEADARSHHHGAVRFR
ncbi:MAG: hypothetical protein FJ122_13735 [Deltaproteobacteria bacterium]|nr:hypothetical protein [Deltaproteobacteria bacterium]